MLCRDFHETMIEYLRKTLNIGYSIAITELYNGDVAHFDDVFEMGDCFRGYYYKYSEYYQCPPIDDELIKLMQPYDMEILKMMDRHQGRKWNFEKRMQVYYEHIRFWNYILSVYSIDVVIFLNVPHEVFDYVIYALCKEKGINTITCFTPPVFWDRAIVSKDFQNENHVIRKYMEEHTNKNVSYSEEVIKKYDGFINEFADNKGRKSRWWSGVTSRANIKYMSVMDVREFIESDDGKNGYIRQLVKHHKHIAGALARGFYIKNWIKTSKLDLQYQKLAEKIKFNEKFVLFALHYQPEATSAPLGGGIYSNQLIPIKILASTLPEGCYLYVKEHPAQTQVGRDTCLYDYIRRIKNVRIISKDVDTYLLLRYAMATASLTGTIIIESITNGIPAIAFGNFAYNCLEGVFEVRTKLECQRAIDSIFSGSFTINQCKVKKYFQMIYDYSRPFNIGYGEYDNDENAFEMSKALGEKLGEIVVPTN